MNTQSLQIAALMCSRLCHDLISPVGAIANGLEVMRDEEDDEMRAHALTLIEASVQQAGARLQYARLAFGVAGSAGSDVDLGEARRLLSELLIRGKVEIVWGLPEHAVAKDIVKLLLNVLLVAIDCVPRGGRVSVTGEPRPGGELAVRADGPKARLAPDVREALFGETALDALDSRQIQPSYTGLIAGALGARLSAQEGENSVAFSVALPAA